MTVEGAVQNLGSLCNTCFDSDRSVLTHPALDHFKGQAQLLQFFSLILQELEDIFQSPISRKSLTFFMTHVFSHAFCFFIHK